MPTAPSFTDSEQTLLYKIASQFNSAASFTDHIHDLTYMIAVGVDGAVIPDAPSNGQTYGRNNGAWVPFTQFSLKATDQSVTESTDLVDSVDLSLPLAANSTYRFEIGLLLTENGGGISSFTSVPSGSSVFGKWNYIDGSTPSITPTATSINTLALILNGATGSVFQSTVIFSLVTGSSAGNVTFQFAQNASDPSDSTIKAGSWIKADLVS